MKVCLKKQTPNNPEIENHNHEIDQLLALVTVSAKSRLS